MDPVSNDPHHPPPFTAFHPFTNSYAPPPASNNPVFGGAPNSSAVAPTNNTNFFHPQLPLQVSSPPTHPPYSDMICTAIAALNEPDGSSKQAISRYIERTYAGIPPAHAPLLTHHLKTLKNHGILTLVKKSYKFAATSPPTSVAVAAEAAAAGLEHPRSDFAVSQNQISPNPIASSTPSSQKRGRGRPPKIKLDVQQPNGTATWQQNQLTVAVPEEAKLQSPPSIRRPPGRPRKDGALTVVNASSSGKQRGRPPSGRVAGRERKPTVVSAPVSVFPYIANGGGVRRRGRPRRVHFGASLAAPPPPPPNAESGGKELALVVPKKRGRGRPPKIGGVTRMPMKPISRYIRTGKPRGRPSRKFSASGQQNAGYGELKKKFDLFQEKAKEIASVLKSEIGGIENQVVVEAIKALEELTTTTKETTDEPLPMVEVMQPQEHHEPEPEPLPEPERLGQVQTETEAMHEALF